MAKYTVELGEVAKSGLKIFNFEYEFYDESKKNDFEKKFINHFYFREIGVETVGRFQHYLKCKCDESLPYYNMLFKTAQIEYDLLNNYNLTETFNKTNTKTATGNATQSGSTSDSSHLTGTVNHNDTINVEGDKTNTLKSTTDHTENTDFTKDETINETGKIDKNTTVNVDDKKVGSDTPNGLLSMEDIKNNVYASRADIQDGTTTTTDGQTSSADKTGTSTEATERSSTDKVDATSTDKTTDKTVQFGTDTTNNTTTSSGTVNTTADTAQSENGSENYTMTRVGNIGVDKPSDMLAKHVEFQKTMTTI
jgi:hypothetical protein